MTPKPDSYREASPVREGREEGPAEEARGRELLAVPEVPRDLLRDDDRIRTRWIHRAFLWTFVIALLVGINDLRGRPSAGWFLNGVALLALAVTVSALVAFLTGCLFTFRRQETAGERWARQRKRAKARREASSPDAGRAPEGPAEGRPSDPRIQQ